MSERPTETDAIRADAEARLGELRRVAAVLRPDAEDAAVMSELTVIESEIRSAEKALSR